MRTLLTLTVRDVSSELTGRPRHSGISAKSNSPPSLAASESFETIAPFDETLPGQTFHRTFLVDGGKWTFRAPYVPATDVFSPRWLRQFSTPIGATLPPEALCVYCSFDETIAWSTLPGARGWYDLEGMAWSDHLVVRHGISPFFRGYFAPPAVLRKSCMTSMFCMQLDDGYCRTCGEWVTAAAMWTVPEAGYGSQLTADWRMWWRHASGTWQMNVRYVLSAHCGSGDRVSRRCDRRGPANSGIDLDVLRDPDSFAHSPSHIALHRLRGIDSFLAPCWPKR